MSYRRNPITGEPVVFAPERAARPHAFTADTSETACPFCPGNEQETPPELLHIGEPWRVRLFPNKYPPAAGAEVLVESSHHGATFGDLETAEEVVQLYLDRYRFHRDEGAAYVAVFKNEGARAGSSIDHVHSQIVPVAMVPPRIEREAAAFADSSRCPLCAAIEGHVIGENEHFRWVAPFGSSFAYQQWIVPRKHVHEIGAFDAASLASMLRQASRAMLGIAGAYNWAFMSFPGAPAAHAYIDLIPRMTAIAGFELGTGMFVEIVDPAVTAKALQTK